MNFEYFFEHLIQRFEQVSLYKNLINERVKEMEIPKGQVLLYPGEVCKYVYFVHSGFFRLYQLNEGQERTVDFAGPNQFFTSLDSFFSQRTGHEGLICEQKGIVFRLSYYDLLSLEDQSPLFITLSKTILQEYITLFNREKNIFRTSNATQKYLFLCAQHPQLSQTISQKHIASYLGITEQSMSLIRKSLLR